MYVVQEKKHKQTSEINPLEMSVFAKLVLRPFPVLYTHYVTMPATVNKHSELF
jgi:hypothetical protein